MLVPSHKTKGFFVWGWNDLPPGPSCDLLLTARNRPAVTYILRNTFGFVNALYSDFYLSSSGRWKARTKAVAHWAGPPRNPAAPSPSRPVQPGLRNNSTLCPTPATSLSVPGSAALGQVIPPQNPSQLDVHTQRLTCSKQLYSR